MNKSRHAKDFSARLMGQDGQILIPRKSGCPGVLWFSTVLGRRSLSGDTAEHAGLNSVWTPFCMLRFKAGGWSLVWTEVSERQRGRMTRPARLATRSSASTK